MTATPKVKEGANNLDYFNEPLYTYSLKQGIEAVSYTHLAFCDRNRREAYSEKLRCYCGRVEVAHRIPVSYTHLDVYKRQIQKYPHHSSNG